MPEPLDNPVWHALIGPHAGFARGRGAARHYPREIGPFSAIAEPTEAAYADLAADLAPGQDAMLLRPQQEPVPAGWEAPDGRLVEQMILSTGHPLPDPSPAEVAAVPLGPRDADDMQALVELTRPGPFGPRTVELGRYVGVRDPGGRLVAIAGERFRLSGYVEVSAVCVHPDAQGQGLGGAMTLSVIRAALARGEMPILHVWPDNPARSLYGRLGFRLRATLWVLWRRPVAPNRVDSSI